MFLNNLKKHVTILIINAHRKVKFVADFNSILLLEINILKIKYKKPRSK